MTNTRGSITLALKLAVIAVVSVVILLALAWIASVISEREGYRGQALKSISESYATGQRLVGPVMIQPYSIVETLHRPKLPDETRESPGRYTVFPTEMRIYGTMVPSERYHGLYKVSVYELRANLRSTIDVPASPISGTARYQKPFLIFAVSNVRGLVGTPLLRVNGQPVALTQSKDGDAKMALRALLPEVEGGRPARLEVDLELTLAGTQHLAIAPIANSNHLEITSSWPSPLFAGKFLPRSREISGSGFKAAWDVSSLASATQQQMGADLTGDMDTVDVDLLQPIDPYKLSMRVVKYGVLFVLLTFAGFFVFEFMQRLPIHPVQYLLVGLALAIFFLLLVSFSEHLRFGLAYLIASVATIGLLGFYLSFVLRSVNRGTGFAALLTVLYGAVYGLLLSEDNALLLGSVLLFAVLAGVMYVTRSVDWYRGTEALVQAQSGGVTNK